MAPLVWLITGCSSGFGEQFVHSILARGYRVIATARRIERIKHLQASGATTLGLDVTSSQASINDIVAEAHAAHGQIDVVVNNAGYVATGTWEDVSHEQMLAQFETNLFGPMKVTRAILPYMRQRRSGTLVFIGSLSGWIGHKGITPYASSKHALEGAVESLRLDVAPFGISTLLVEPGRFRTTLLSDQNLKATGSTIGDYAEAGTNLREGLAAEDRRQPGDPVKLVEIVLDVVRGEGVAQGREMPFRLPLGTDCYEEVRGKCQETLRLLEEWKAVGLSMDF